MRPKPRPHQRNLRNTLQPPSPQTSPNLKRRSIPNIPPRRLNPRPLPRSHIPRREDLNPILSRIPRRLALLLHESRPMARVPEMRPSGHVHGSGGAVPDRGIGACDEHLARGQQDGGGVVEARDGGGGQGCEAGAWGGGGVVD